MSDAVTEKRESLLAFLRDEGYQPHTEDGVEIVFKKEGRTYFTVADDDPNYFSVYCFMNFESHVGDRQTGLEAANSVSRSLKSVKVTLPDPANPHLVSFGVETLLPAPEAFRSVFARSLEVLGISIGRFLEIAAAPREMPN
jgi:hypothetical protein